MILNYKLWIISYKYFRWGFRFLTWPTNRSQWMSKCPRVLHFSCPHIGTDHDVDFQQDTWNALRARHLVWSTTNASFDFQECYVAVASTYSRVNATRNGSLVTCAKTSGETSFIMWANIRRQKLPCIYHLLHYNALVY